MNNNREKFIQLLIILIGLFVFIFFARPMFYDLIWNWDLNTQKNKIYKEKLEELDTLSKRKRDLTNAKKWTKNSADFQKIKKYLEPVSEDKIINEIYSMAENRINWKVKILSLTMWKWVKNELGFMESKLNISAVVDSEKTMKEIFDYLNDSSKYKIFINSFNMPKKSTTLGYRITIPATIFYVESK